MSAAYRERVAEALTAGWHVAGVHATSDGGRVRALLARLVAEGAKSGLDADFTRRFFRRAA